MLCKGKQFDLISNKRDKLVKYTQQILKQNTVYCRILKYNHLYMISVNYISDLIVGISLASKLVVQMA